MDISMVHNNYFKIICTSSFFTSLHIWKDPVSQIFYEGCPKKLCFYEFLGMIGWYSSYGKKCDIYGQVYKTFLKKIRKNLIIFVPISILWKLKGL